MELGIETMCPLCCADFSYNHTCSHCNNAVGCDNCINKVFNGKDTATCTMCRGKWLKKKRGRGFIKTGYSVSSACKAMLDVYYRMHTHKNDDTEDAESADNNDEPVANSGSSSPAAARFSREGSRHSSRVEDQLVEPRIDRDSTFDEDFGFNPTVCHQFC